MKRGRALKIVLVFVGLLFSAGIYFIAMDLWRPGHEPTGTMMLSLYVTLGIFLLLAAPNPSAHRSLIVYAGWANVAHATVMGVQAFLNLIARRELAGVAIFFVIGITLIALAPAKQPVERFSAVVA